MKYLDLHHNFANRPVFSLNDIRRIEGGFYRSRLNEWQSRGYIEKLTRGFYRFSGTKPDQEALFEIAGRIYNPSYVSCETALSYYGLIPEGAYQVTSVTTRKSYLFMTPVGSFRYRSTLPALFFGYEPVRSQGRFYKLALPEKAIIDLLHYRHDLSEDDDFEALRLDTARLRGLVRGQRFREYIARYNAHGLKERAAAFKEYIEHA